MKTSNMQNVNRFGMVVIFLPLLALNSPAAGWPVVRHFDKDHLYRVALPMKS